MHNSEELATENFTDDPVFLPDVFEGISDIHVFSLILASFYANPGKNLCERQLLDALQWVGLKLSKKRLALTMDEFSGWLADDPRLPFELHRPSPTEWKLAPKNVAISALAFPEELSEEQLTEKDLMVLSVIVFKAGGLPLIQSEIELIMGADCTYNFNKLEELALITKSNVDGRNYWKPTKKMLTTFKFKRFDQIPKIEEFCKMLTLEMENRIANPPPEPHPI